ncbi:MAG: hypothetical protein ACO3JL_02540, partial [Myxococcota bacterium]
MSVGSPAPASTPPEDASRHARAAARIVFGAMGIAVLIALAITVVGLGMRAEQERSAESVTPQATST